MCSYMRKCVCMCAEARGWLWMLSSDAVCLTLLTQKLFTKPRAAHYLDCLGHPALGIFCLYPEHWDWRLLLSLAFSCGSWVSELTFLMLCSEHCSEWWILPAPEDLLLLSLMFCLPKIKDLVYSLGYLWTLSSYLSLPVLVLWAQTSIFSLVFF